MHPVHGRPFSFGSVFSKRRGILTALIFCLFVHRVCAQEQVEDTAFSVNRGFYSSSVELEISTLTPGASIYFTTDGSLPTAESGTVYEVPVEISSTTVVRAFAEAPGMTPTNVDTHTYLFPSDIVTQASSISGYARSNYSTGGGGPTVRMDYEMDPTIVEDPAYSADLIQAFADIPSLCLSVDPDDIFGTRNFYDGENVEEQVAVEVLYPGDPSANEKVEAGVESHSHKRLKRSLRLNFRAEYGDSKWRTNLFRKAPFNPGNRATPNEVDRVILRAGNNRAWSRTFLREKTTYALDEFARLSQQAMGGDGMRGAFVHLFINGVYWGLYNPVIRADTFYTSATYGGDEQDWFAVNHGGDLKGNDDRYDYLKGTLKDKDMSVDGNYEELEEHLDIDNFIDYLLLHWYTNTGDWPQNNWYGGLRNASGDDGPLPMKFFAWDGEWSWDLPHPSISNIAPDPDDTWVHPDFRAGEGKDGSRVISNLFNSAKENELFVRRLGDRAYKHLANGGALTDQASEARFQGLVDYLRNAVVAESARWGDSLDTDSNGSPLFARDDQWAQEVMDIFDYIDGREGKALLVLRDEGYYPDLEPPKYHQHGGNVSPGFELTIELGSQGSGHEIYYTLNGSDPAEDGVLYQGPIELSESTRVLSRVTDGSNWSAAADAVYHVPVSLSLLISELHYNPSSATSEEQGLGHTGENDFEYLEFHNAGSESIDLSGYQFTSGISLNLPTPSVLEAGETAVVVGDEDCFRFRYGGDAKILGDYSGRLSNDGERLVLRTALGQDVIDVTYNDSWHRRSDGKDYSLTLVDTTLSGVDQATWEVPSSWSDSGFPNGTPGSLAQSAIGYSDWLSLHSISEGPDDRDLDGDGASDFMEYVFGTHPLRRDVSPFEVSDDWVRYTLRVDRTDASISPQFSSTMNQNDWSGVSSVSEDSGGYETHTVEWSKTGREFFRLLVERP